MYRVYLLLRCGTGRLYIQGWWACASFVRNKRHTDSFAVVSILLFYVKPYNTLCTWCFSGCTVVQVVYTFKDGGLVQASSEIRAWWHTYSFVVVSFLLFYVKPYNTLFTGCYYGCTVVQVVCTFKDGGLVQASSDIIYI